MQKTHGVPDGNPRVQAAFFHPDYHRRLRPLTESADLSHKQESARGLVGWLCPPTAGGEFHPALKTGAE